MRAKHPPHSATIRAERVWDPATGIIDGPVTVGVAGGVITCVSRSDDAPAASEGDLIDLGPGVTLLPGLVDCHAHLCWNPGADHATDFLSADDSALVARVSLACDQLLDAGITTVRDLGDARYITLACRDEIRRRPWSGPEILASGPPITPARGHCWFLGSETNADDVVDAVRERADHGVDVIKIMATGGRITPGSAPHESQYDAPTLARAVQAARKQSLPITAHAHGWAGIRDALAAGVTGIEHCTFLTADDVACDWTVVEAIARSGVAVSAPEASWHGSATLPARDLLERVWANLVAMHRAGVRLSISSDSGISPAKPHGVLPRGAVLLVDRGLPNHDALVAITAAPAGACGLAHRKGRIARGFDADLLVVDGDPIADIAALLRPVAVFRAGRAVRSRAGRASWPAALGVDQ
jgi:imidazolonepropionase-like amidohydrolase